MANAQTTPTKCWENLIISGIDLQPEDCNDEDNVSSKSDGREKQWSQQIQYGLDDVTSRRGEWKKVSYTGAATLARPLPVALQVQTSYLDGNDNL